MDFIVIKYYLNILWGFFFFGLVGCLFFFLILFFPFKKKVKLNLILTNLEAAFQYISGQDLLKKKLERRTTNYIELKYL